MRPARLLQACGVTTNVPAPMAQSVPPKSPHEQQPAADRTSGPRWVASAPSRGRARRWLPEPRTRLDALRRLLGPVLLAVVPLFWVIDATYRASITTVTRDQGIFQ